MTSVVMEDKSANDPVNESVKLNIFGKNILRETCKEKNCDEKQDSQNVTGTSIIAPNLENANSAESDVLEENSYNLNIPTTGEKISKLSDADTVAKSINKMLNVDENLELIDRDFIVTNATTEKHENDKVVHETLVQKVSNMDISENIQTAPCKSEVILKNPTESLKHLLIYDNSSDDDDDGYDDFEKNWQLQAVESSSDSDSDSTESLDEHDTDDTADEISSDTVFTPNTGAIKKDCIKSSTILLDELDLYLPPLLDLSTLKIDYEKEEFLHIGKIKAIIETLVTVEAIPGTPAYDLDSVLFVNSQTMKRPFGTIYDVIGPVSAPIYCVRFDNKEQIDELCLKLGQNVYSAPKSQYTRYVFVRELMNVRGSDASWVGDKELPPELAEISDAEDEDVTGETRKASKRQYGSLERHRQFEKSMNMCNTLNSRVAQLVDTHHKLSRCPPRHRSTQNGIHRSAGIQRNAGIPVSSHTKDLSRLLAPFDPTVPPPGFRNNFADGYRAHGNSNSGPRPIWTWTPPELYHNVNYGMDRNSLSLNASGGGERDQRNVQGNNNSAHYRTNHAARQAGPSNRPY